MSFKYPHEYYSHDGTRAARDSDQLEGENFAFTIPIPGADEQFFYVLAGMVAMWERVKVHSFIRPPTIEDMVFIRSLFWDESDSILIEIEPEIATPLGLDTIVHTRCMLRQILTGEKVKTEHYRDMRILT